MRFISWNVNGLRSCVGKGFEDFFKFINADVFAIQETKLQPDQIELVMPDYKQFFHSAVKKGYSGTAVFTKHEPLSVQYDFAAANSTGLANEGRVITLELDDMYFVDCYTPNSQRELTRLDARMLWEDAFREYLIELDAKKPVVLCGDLNVAHCEIDIANPKTNHKNAGFTDEERAKFTILLESGFTDSFRFLHPEQAGAYSWWSYMSNSRQRNIGWRIDYFVISNRLQERLNTSIILPEIMGSDHCPVMLELK